MHECGCRKSALSCWTSWSSFLSRSVPRKSRRAFSGHFTNQLFGMHMHGPDAFKPQQHLGIYAPVGYMLHNPQPGASFCMCTQTEACGNLNVALATTESKGAGQSDLADFNINVLYLHHSLQQTSTMCIHNQISAAVMRQALYSWH